jgi:hypothetical protein
LAIRGQAFERMQPVLRAIAKWTIEQRVASLWKIENEDGLKAVS